MTRTVSSASRSQMQGYSLVELMISMALGLVILLAVSEIFVSNSKTRNEIEKSGRQIENGRFAIQLLSDEIANAGFAGEGGIADLYAAPPTGVDDACVYPASAAIPESPADVVQRALSLPVFGGLSKPTCAGSFKADNGFIAIRRVSTCAVGASGCDAFLVNHYHLQVAACESSSANPSGERVIGNVLSEMTAQTRACTAVKAPIYRFLSRLYYVNADDTLVRAELVGSEYQISPLVEGIERLEFEYGVDDAPFTGVVATFKRAEDMSGSDWAAVLAVRIWLVARNLEPTSGHTDDSSYTLAGQEYLVENRRNYKRQVFSGVAPINNLLEAN